MCPAPSDKHPKPPKHPPAPPSKKAVPERQDKPNRKPQEYTGNVPHPDIEKSAPYAKK